MAYEKRSAFRPNNTHSNPSWQSTDTDHSASALPFYSVAKKKKAIRTSFSHISNARLQNSQIMLGKDPTNQYCGFQLDANAKCGSRSPPTYPIGPFKSRSPLKVWVSAFNVRLELLLQKPSHSHIIQIGFKPVMFLGTKVWGEGLNNAAEMQAVPILMTSALEMVVREVQVFGDSKLIIP